MLTKNSTLKIRTTPKMADSSKIEKLDENNYGTWKILIRAVCVKNRTWNHVQGTEPAPTVIENSDKASEQLLEQFEAWQQKDDEACSDLLLSLKTSQIKHIKNMPETRTAHDIWKRLKEVHDISGDTTIVSLITELVTKRLTNEDELEKHLAFYSDTMDSLADYDFIKPKMF